MIPHSDKPILQLEQFRFRIAGQWAAPRDCRLYSGQVLWIQGPNGSGKTTFVQAILDTIVIPNSRSIVPSKHHVAYMPQLLNKTIPWPLTLSDALHLYDRPPKQSITSADQRNPLAWNTASGGERQRVLLQRALHQNPTLLIADEPLNHLDKQTQTWLIDALSEYLKNGGAAIIVEHHRIPEKLSQHLSEIIEF